MGGGTDLLAVVGVPVYDCRMKRLQGPGFNVCICIQSMVLNPVPIPHSPSPPCLKTFHPLHEMQF